MNRITAKVSVNGTGAQVDIDRALGYAVEGYILPVFDPDTFLTYDSLWNRLVPKDTDVQAMDLDTTAGDATPFWEPGEADWSKVLRIGLQPEKIYGRKRLLTYATSPAKVIDTATPFLPGFIPADSFKIDIKKNFFVEQPSVIVFAFASPTFDDTTTTAEGTLLEDEWGRVKYMGEVLKKAHMDLLGITESTAETPWEEATDLMQKHLQPDVFEETAAAFGNATFNVFTEAIIDHSVVGELGKVAISLG